MPNSAGSAADGTAVIHVTGACLAVIIGNVMAIVVGAHSRTAGAPRWYRVTSLALGASGLSGFLGVAAIEVPTPGAILERIAVYAVLVWRLVTALSLLVRTHVITGAAGRSPVMSVISPRIS